MTSSLVLQKLETRAEGAWSRTDQDRGVARAALIEASPICLHEEFESKAAIMG
jgi:hypothetical protein